MPSCCLVILMLSTALYAVEADQDHSAQKPLFFEDSLWWFQSDDTKPRVWDRIHFNSNGRFEIWTQALSNEDHGNLIIDGTWTRHADGSISLDGYGLQDMAHITWDGKNWTWTLRFTEAADIVFLRRMGC